MNDSPTTPPLPPSVFLDPYSDLGGKYQPGTHGRIQCDISREDYNKFYHILPARGDAVFQTTFSILTKKLLDALDKAGIRSYDDGDEYKQFITDLKLEDGRKNKVKRVKKEKAGYGVGGQV